MRRRTAALALSLTLLAGCGLFSRQDPNDQPTRVVFFTEDSAALDDTAKSVVSAAADYANRVPSASVRVLGYADPDGGPAYNKALSGARAENVATYLRDKGIAPERISVGARGPVSFEMAPIESRRVEIRIGS